MGGGGKGSAVETPSQGGKQQLALPEGECDEPRCPEGDLEILHTLVSGLESLTLVVSQLKRELFHPGS